MKLKLTIISYILNIFGPSPLPCGNPLGMNFHSENELLTITRCFRLLRKAEIYPISPSGKDN